MPGKETFLLTPSFMTEAKGEKGITLLYKTSSLLAQKFIIKEGEKEDVPCAREKINRIKF